MNGITSIFKTHDKSIDLMNESQCSIDKNNFRGNNKCDKKPCFFIMNNNNFNQTSSFGQWKDNSSSGFQSGSQQHPRYSATSTTTGLSPCSRRHFPDPDWQAGQRWPPRLSALEASGRTPARYIGCAT